MSFEPRVGDIFEIEGRRYAVAEHPAAPGMSYGQEGRAGIVYKLLPSPLGRGAGGEGLPSPLGRGAGGEGNALKVFKPRFRLPYLVSQAQKIAAFAALPGLAACRRTVLTPSRYADLLRQYPDLTYAVLMPWIDGPTWQEVLLEGRPLSPEQSLALARSLAQVLLGLEEQGIAHCDLSAPNVMLPYLTPLPPSPSPLSEPERGEGAQGVRGEVQLVDLEGLYAPGMPRPQELSSGSMGYAHRQAAGGLWGPEADRFAGAVLLAEMLGFCDPQVVQAAWGESYFDPAEMQRDCPRYRILLDALQRNWGDGVAALFQRAWASDTLADCPTFGEWMVVLPERPPVAQTFSLPVSAPATEAAPPALSPTDLTRAQVQALMEAARQLEEAGHIESAVLTYRQAQALAAADPALASLAREIGLVVQGLEGRLQRVAPAIPTPAPAPPSPPPLAVAARPEWSERPVAEERPRRRRRGWIWAVMALLVVAGIVALAFWQQQVQEQRAQALCARSATPIFSETADWVVQLARRGEQTVNQVAYSPDGRLLAVTSSLGVYLHDARTLQKVRFLESPAWVTSVAFSPDGQTLVSGSWDNTVRLWRVADGTLLRTLEGHAGLVESVVFSPDGGTLASGSLDGTVQLWETR